MHKTDHRVLLTWSSLPPSHHLSDWDTQIYVTHLFRTFQPAQDALFPHPIPVNKPLKKKKKTGFWYSWKDRSNTCVICPTPSFSWNQVSLFFPGKFIFFPSFPLSSAEHSVKVWYSLPQSVAEMNLRDNPINQTQIRLFQGNKAHWDTKIIL